MERAVDRGWFFCPYMPVVSGRLGKSLSLLQTGTNGCVGDFAPSSEHPLRNTRIFSGFSAVFHWSASLSFYRFHSLDFCSSILTWFPQLCPVFSKLFCLVYIFGLSIQIWESACRFLPEFLLGPWLGWHGPLRSAQREQTSWQPCSQGRSRWLFLLCRSRLSSLVRVFSFGHLVLCMFY